MVVPSELQSGAIADYLAAYQEPLLQSVELFDLFEDPSGEKLEAGKKSLAYSVSYRSADRTLEAAEVETAHGKLLDSLKRELNVAFR